MQEGLSRALVEAISRALLCIASNCGGNPELLDERYIVKLKPNKGYVDRIVDTIASIFTEDNYRAEAFRNLEIAKARFNTRYLDELRDIYYESFVAFIRGNLL